MAAFWTLYVLLLLSSYGAWVLRVYILGEFNNLHQYFYRWQRILCILHTIDTWNFCIKKFDVKICSWYFCYKAISVFEFLFQIQSIIADRSAIQHVLSTGVYLKKRQQQNSFWGNRSLRFPTMSGTNRAGQSLKMARTWNFGFWEDYTNCEVKKSTDQLCGTTDLPLCFRICKSPVFSCRGSNNDQFNFNVQKYMT